MEVEPNMPLQMGHPDFCDTSYIEDAQVLEVTQCILSTIMKQLVKTSATLIPQQVRGIIDAERSHDSL
jgi:hypothetical protein